MTKWIKTGRDPGRAYLDEEKLPAHTLDAGEDS
jgi:hypothetical protein